MKTRVLLSFCFFLCFGIAAKSFGQTIIAWQPNTEVYSTQYSTSTHALLQPMELTKGAGVDFVYKAIPTIFVGRFPLNDDTNIRTEKPSSVTGNAYYEVKLQAKPGAVLSLSTLKAKLVRGTDNAPNMYRWSYSVDNGANFIEIGSADVPMNDFTTNGNVQAPIDLSGITALQNVPSTTPIIFRIYAWGRKGVATSTTSHFGFGGKIEGLGLEFIGAAEMPITQTAILNWKPATQAADVSLPATETDANILQADLKRGAGLTFTSSSTYTYNSKFPINASRAEAETANSYYEVSMQAKTGYYLNLNGLTARLRRSTTTSPNTYRWVYSLDGTNFTDVGPGDVNMTLTGADDTNGEDQYLIDLSNITALHNISSATLLKFRLYAWGGTENESIMGFGKSYDATASKDYNSLTFYGSVSNTLPVTLTSFKGRTEGSTIKLSWTTTSEQDNSHFEILRSASNELATVIGTVSGNGTSNTLHNYSFKDHAPLTGVNYYQLRQLDYDGESELSEVIAVKNELNYPELSVTASESGITVYTRYGAKGNAQLLVHDVSGRLLLNETLVMTVDNNVLNISIPLYTKGIYIASLIMPDGKRLNARFYK